jgi:hypothetical protein
MPAGFSPAARASDVYVEAMILASPHSAITSAHCLVGVGYTDTKKSASPQTFHLTRHTFAIKLLPRL